MTRFKPGERVMYIGSTGKLKGKIGYVRLVTRYHAHVYFGNGQSGSVALSNLRPAWQVCKDCGGNGAKRISGDCDERITAPCPTCEGVGRINRTGPYRLANGEWSDGVNRRDTLLDCWRDGVFQVWLSREEKNWRVNGANNTDARFPTHAEAIAYAHKKARESA